MKASDNVFLKYTRTGLSFETIAIFC